MRQQYHDSVNWEKFPHVVEQLASQVVDFFEDLSIKSKYRVIKDYISRSVKNVSLQRNWAWKKRSSEYKDSKLRDLISKRRKLACKVKSVVFEGTKEVYVKSLREYQKVRDQIGRRRLRLETEHRFKRSVEAGGRGSRDFW